MKDLVNSGIYKIVDTSNNECVYIGSTKNSFLYRWGCHVEDAKRGNHYNSRLAALINSGMADFKIIEITDKTGNELLARERYYTELYNPKYCINTGGGTLCPSYIVSNRYYEKDKKSNLIREYIDINWRNKKIYLEDKKAIEKYITDNGMKFTKFMAVISRLGFVIQRFNDKRSWLITDKLYE